MCRSGRPSTGRRGATGSRTNRRRWAPVPGPMTEHASGAFKWVSKPGRIREDRRFVQGRGRYVADITPPGTLHVGLVTSPYAHARITAIDTAPALELDGVVAVVTGAELAKAT